jgi:hypothetical protein
LKPFGAPVTVTVPVTVPVPHCPDALLLELPEQHMLEPPLELEVLLTHDWEPTIRLASDVRPKPDAICGSTVTNKTKLATPMTVTRARGFQFFMPHPALSGRVKRTCEDTRAWSLVLGSGLVLSLLRIDPAGSRPIAPSQLSRTFHSALKVLVRMAKEGHRVALSQDVKR